MRENNRWRLSLVACLFVVQAVVTYAAPPETVTLQGVVESSSGDPVSGTAAYRLRFYDAETGGSQLGSDVTGTTTLSSRGRFSIELTPPAAVLSASSAWYEIALDTTTPGDGVDPDDVFQDRIKLTSVPFALQTSDSNNLGGTAAADYATDTELAAGLAGKANSAHTHDINDITGTINADLLNGQDGNYYTNASNLSSGTIPSAMLSLADSDVPDTITASNYLPLLGGALIGVVSTTSTFDGRDVSADGATLDSIDTAAERLTALKNVDGTDSGLDADLLDGQEGLYFTNASNLVSGNLGVGRMPTGGGWTLSSDLNVVGTRNLTIDGNVAVGSYNPLFAKMRVHQTIPTNVKVVLSTIHYNGCDDTSCFFSGERRNGDTWVDTEFKVTGLGKCYADGGWNAAADYAEYFYTENLSISEGDLVSIVEKDYRAEFDAMGEIERASMFNRQDTLGIVSTNPGVTGILVPDTTEDSQVIESDPHYKTVGLLGQVPGKVLFTNEVLSSGDPIGPSCLAGIGMKATQPGQIVAKALEGFETSGAIDVASLDDIDWPEDDGTNPAKPCFRVPISSFGSEIQEALAADHGLQPSDHIYVGKIMVFVNVSWYDPDPDAGALERERLAAENRVLQTDISILHDRLERLEAMLGVSNDTH